MIVVSRKTQRNASASSPRSKVKEKYSANDKEAGSVDNANDREILYYNDSIKEILGLNDPSKYFKRPIFAQRDAKKPEENT